MVIHEIWLVVCKSLLRQYFCNSWYLTIYKLLALPGAVWMVDLTVKLTHVVLMEEQVTYVISQLSRLTYYTHLLHSCTLISQLLIPFEVMCSIWFHVLWKWYVSSRCHWEGIQVHFLKWNVMKSLIRKGLGWTSNLWVQSCLPLLWDNLCKVVPLCCVRQFVKSYFPLLCQAICAELYPFAVSGKFFPLRCLFHWTYFQAIMSAIS